ncbi:MAG: Regulatory subunit of type II PKA R-subunit, variant 2 [Marteilia pararefringens]
MSNLAQEDRFNKNNKFRVPRGFNYLLECLTREILRDNPENIYEFSANFFCNMKHRFESNFSYKF